MQQEKQKAEELINKFIDFTIHSLDKTLQNAQHCAFICAREIISELKDTPNTPYTERKIEFYEKVKKQILDYEQSR